MNRFAKRKSRGAIWALAVFFVLIVAAFLAQSRAADSAEASNPETGIDAATWDGEVTVSVASPVVAGSPLDVHIDAHTAPDGLAVDVALFSAVQTVQYSTQVVDGEATWPIPAEAMTHAGLAELVVRVGATQSSSEIEVLPGDVVAPVVPLVGPRTIVADAQDFSMLVTTPVDRFGNPAPDWTPVSIAVRRPDGSLLPLLVVVDDGIAATLVPADTTAGRLTLSASVGDVDGPPVALDQVAGTPVEIAVELGASGNGASALIADGFTLYPVTTSVLADAFGNVMPDGIEVMFVVEGPDGTDLVETTVQAGRATTRLEAPSAPGDVVVRALVSGQESTPFELAFSTAVVEASARLRGDGTLVEIGPVLGAAGGFVPDGTPAEVVAPDGSVVAVGALLDGVDRVPLPLGADASQLRVRVLGSIIEVGA